MANSPGRPRLYPERVQVKFRVVPEIMDRIHEAAEHYDGNLNQWLVDAVLARLNGTVEAPPVLDVEALNSGPVAYDDDDFFPAEGEESVEDRVSVSE